MNKLGLIGFGSMGGAIAEAIIQAGALSPDDMAVFEVNPRAKEKALSMGIHLCASAVDLCRESSMILLAVKPQKAASALQGAGEALEGKALMSIAAGVSARKLKEFGGSCYLRVLRIMPNIPAKVGAGCMALCRETNFTQEEQREAERLMSAVGIVEWIPEDRFDAVTALSGSGPAFVAMFIEALADGGVREGLSRLQAMHLATQTVLGTAKLLQTSGMHPGELKDMVCSPGGTAIEGVEMLESRGMRTAVIEAVTAAGEKSRRMI